MHVFQLLRSIFDRICLLLLLAAISINDAYAYVDGYHFEDVDRKGHFYQLMTGGFGSFVMVFMGLGGMASLFMTRASRSRQGVPLLGVGMMAIAISLFAFRIAVKAGVMGHEYLEW